MKDKEQGAGVGAEDGDTDKAVDVAAAAAAAPPAPGAAPATPAVAAAASAPTGFVFPDGQTLNPRVRRLIDLVLKAIRQVDGGEAVEAPAGGAAATAGGAEAGEGGATAAAAAAKRRKSDKPEKAELWSRKDRLDVMGLILRFGMPAAAVAAVVAAAQPAAAQPPKPEEGAAAVPGEAAAAEGGSGPAEGAVKAEGVVKAEQDAAADAPGAAPAPASPGFRPVSAAARQAGEDAAALSAALDRIVAAARAHVPRLGNKSDAGIKQVRRVSL